MKFIIQEAFAGLVGISFKVHWKGLGFS